MADLTKNQESFIELMKKSEEHAFRGFELLGKRDDLDKFFDALDSAGFFAPERNPAPIPVEPAGSVRIPFWPALGYLLACAAVSDQRNDLALGQRVMNVVRAVSAFREPDGSVRDNYHTFRKFAEILGIVPSAIVLNTDVQLASVWLSSRFDTDGVAHTLDIGPIRRFLASDDRENWSPHPSAASNALNASRAWGVSGLRRGAVPCPFFRPGVTISPRAQSTSVRLSWRNCIGVIGAYARTRTRALVRDGLSASWPVSRMASMIN